MTLRNIKYANKDNGTNKMVKQMKTKINKKGEGGIFEGSSVLMWMAAIVVVAILAGLLIVNYTKGGSAMWDKIKNIAFV